MVERMTKKSQPLSYLLIFDVLIYMLYGPHGRAQRKCPRCRWIVEDEGGREGTGVKLRTSTTLCITSGGEHSKIYVSSLATKRPKRFIIEIEIVEQKKKPCLVFQHQC